MSRDAYEEEDIQRGPFTFHVERCFDYDNPFATELLGDYSTKPADYCIDRKTGHMLDPVEEHVYTLRGAHRGKLNWREFDDEDPSEEIKLSRKDAKWFLDVWFGGWDSETLERSISDGPEDGTLEAYVCGRRVIGESNIARYQRHEFRYFVPNVDNYKGIDEAELIRYCLQDYERAENYGHEWWSTYVRVACLLDGTEIDFDSIGGIESDSGEDYYQETIQGMIAGLLKRLPDTVAYHRGLADKIESALVALQRVEAEV